MQEHQVVVYPSAKTPPREELLAWKLAEIAAASQLPSPDVVEMVINRLIDNAGVAIAGIHRLPVANARAQALCHRKAGGATLFGLPADVQVSCEWGAWANSTAVRELDFHDTFLAADMHHPGDMIPALVAVSQQCGCSGPDLIRGIATAYEVAVDLAKGMCLHEHRIDHIMHLGAGMAAGIGAALRLPVGIIYQAINHAVHATVTTRQSRKGEISTWKAYAPAHAGKIAIEAIDRAMRGETSPTPIYEGDDSIIAWLLDGADAKYMIPLPAPGEDMRAILDTYTKAYSAEIQAQALIDLAFRMRSRIAALADVKDIVIHTSLHTHRIIGTGSGDPQKFDPKASRETLDHSVMYIFAVALEDGVWHHEHSYAPERASRPATITLWHSIRTVEDADWTRRYHSTDPAQRAFGGRVVVTLRNGQAIEDEIAFADAHPLGQRPFKRADYVAKFNTLAVAASEAERARFLEAAFSLPDLPAASVRVLSVEVPAGVRDRFVLVPGLFEKSA